jgi:hypothetical protein
MDNKKNKTETNNDGVIEENKTLKEQVELLREQAKELKLIIEKLDKENNKPWGQQVDEHVDEWFEKFKDDVDIGRVSTFEFFGRKYEIDVLPDVMEKAIYKKCIKIIFAMLMDASYNMCK